MGYYTKDIFYNIVKTIGGFSSLLYAIYLKCTGRLPYSVEMTLKPECKEKYLKIEIVSYLLYFIILLSLLFFMILSSFDRMVIYCIHLIIILFIFLTKVWLKKDMYK